MMNWFLLSKFAAWEYPKPKYIYMPPAGNYGYWITPQGEKISVPNQQHDRTALENGLGKDKYQAMGKGNIHVITTPGNKSIIFTKWPNRAQQQALEDLVMGSSDSWEISKHDGNTTTWTREVDPENFKQFMSQPITSTQKENPFVPQKKGPNQQIMEMMKRKNVQPIQYSDPEDEDMTDPLGLLKKKRPQKLTPEEMLFQKIRGMN